MKDDLVRLFNLNLVRNRGAAGTLTPSSQNRTLRQGHDPARHHGDSSIGVDR